MLVKVKCYCVRIPFSFICTCLFLSLVVYLHYLRTWTLCDIVGEVYMFCVIIFLAYGSM